MKPHIHLVSMPMHDPIQPSAQLGYLHGFIDKEFANSVSLSSYSGHLNVMYSWKQEDMRHAYYDHRLFGEELFFLACCYEYPKMFERVFSQYQNYALAQKHVSREEIAKLCQALRTYVRDTLLPSIKPDAINLFGFTTTFSQVFASIFVAKELKKLSKEKLLFLFGGASITLPEIRNVFELWEVDGLIIRGSGEGPLSELINCIIQNSHVSVEDLMTNISTSNINNLSFIGGNFPQLDLKLTKKFLNQIGDPNYDEYFDNLRSICSNNQIFHSLKNIIAIPLEGSRGCFAKCDFCQNPFITTEFRTLKGETVAERSIRLNERYETQKIYFADSVCNTWAEAYANRLIEKNLSYESFMEMRVHAPEAFFTKLSIAGVNELQLGVEAVSQPLLKRMNKGTTVWQNLRAVKYLEELGIESTSNLITHHPRSTLEDIKETKRLVSSMLHLKPFSLSKFVISYASPIYNELTVNHRESLLRGFTWVPEDLRPYTTQRDLAYPYPRDWMDEALYLGWEEFRTWYREITEKNYASPPSLVMETIESCANISDNRNSDKQIKKYILQEADTCILNLAHHAPRKIDLVKQSGMTRAEVENILETLTEKALVLDLGERILSLPLRHRKDLISNLDQTHDKSIKVSLDA